MGWNGSRALARVGGVLSIAFGAMLPAQAQDAQACNQAADSCETACAVAALTNALLTKGKSDGNRENAECAARCQATKNQCLAGPQSRPVAPAAPVQPAPAASGPSVAECQERITSIHRRSDAEFQRHRSDPLASSRVLYESNRAQRNLFAGDCAGHPNAAGYIAGAEQGMRDWSAKCVQFGGTPDCGGTAPTAQPSYPAAPRPQPQAPAGQDMAHCMRLERSSSGGAALANHCGVTVEATWCTEGGNAGDDCSRGFRNLWTIGAGRSYPVQGRPTRVRWGACRGANTLRGTGELLKYRCVG